jgi:hypothetical protein
VVILRDATVDDRPALQELAAAATGYAGDVYPEEGMGPLNPERGSADGVRVAEDKAGIVGMFSTLVRRNRGGVAVELTGMLVASRAADWGVERLLVLDLRQQSALWGAQEVTILTRPPIDGFFRELGARAVALAAPWGVTGSPRLHMELPV